MTPDARETEMSGNRGEGESVESPGSSERPSADEAAFKARPLSELPPETRARAESLLRGGTEVLDRIHLRQGSPEEDLQAVAALLDHYRLVMKPERGLPTGLNEEIVDVLEGKNPWRLPMIPREHPQLDDEGRLLDRWGEPLFFHAESMDLLQIRSAGEDRRLWTEDDVVFPEL